MLMRGDVGLLHGYLYFVSAVLLIIHVLTVCLLEFT